MCSMSSGSMLDVIIMDIFKNKAKYELKPATNSTFSKMNNENVYLYSGPLKYFSRQEIFKIQQTCYIHIIM